MKEVAMSRLRVWWIPHVGNCNTFYVPVKSVEDGKRLLDTLAAYDAFQLQNNIKPDYCNTGGLEIFDETECEWNDWYLETKDDFFDDVDKYCESDSCDQKEELQVFNQELFKQIDWSKMP